MRYLTLEDSLVLRTTEFRPRKKMDVHSYRMSLKKTDTGPQIVTCAGIIC